MRLENEQKKSRDILLMAPDLGGSPATEGTLGKISEPSDSTGVRGVTGSRGWTLGVLF